MTILNAKANILQKLRSSLTTNTSSDTTHTCEYNWAKIESPIEHFKTLLTNNHAVVIDTTESALAESIQQMISSNDLKCVITSERACEQYPALQDIGAQLPLGRIEAWKEFLFNEVDAAITSATGAIATTGSIILRPGRDEPRSLSLVPPCHIVIVREETLYNDFADAMCAQHWYTAMPTNMVLVSGPSKTADIQQTLAYGAHGPRDLWVFFVRR